VVSTHQVAFSRTKKYIGWWWDNAFEANSLQQSLPAFNDVVINKHGLSYLFLVGLLPTNSARTFRFPEKGSLTTGTDADHVVFGLNKSARSLQRTTPRRLTFRSTSDGHRCCRKDVRPWNDRYRPGRNRCLIRPRCVRSSRASWSELTSPQDVIYQSSYRIL